jgi:antibiotic biosynthesis monooxygenase (ABM) superfamily enzyme
MTSRRTVLGWGGALLLFGAGLLIGANQFGKPKSVVHVVTVRWKADSTPEQRDAALKGVEKMAAAIPGIKNVWLKTLKVQGDNYNNAFVMEFQDEAAFKAYADAPAHQEWNTMYQKVRDESTTHDITN